MKSNRAGIIPDNDRALNPFVHPFYRNWASAFAASATAI
jgi:hypothetical protein